MTNIKIGNSKSSIIIGGSVSNSNVHVSKDSSQKIFDDIQKAIKEIKNDDARKSIAVVVENMKGSVGTPAFVSHYKDFVSVASDHVTTLSPFFSELAQLLA